MRSVTPAIGLWESEIVRIAPDAAVLAGSSLRERLSRTVLVGSFAALVISLFAIATVGVTLGEIYGVVGHGVARRAHELGIRSALGATPWSLVRLVMREACTAAALGTAVGLELVFWLSDFLGSMVYVLSPADGLTLTGLTVLLLLLTTVVAFVPARRGMRIDPAHMLRDNETASGRSGQVPIG